MMDPQVENGEPCTVCGHVMSQAERKQLEPSVLPTAVIPGSLYLGSYDTASRSELLRAMGITHILNVSAVGVAVVAAFTGQTGRLDRCGQGP